MAHIRLYDREGSPFRPDADDAECVAYSIIMHTVLEDQTYIALVLLRRAQKKLYVLKGGVGALRVEPVTETEAEIVAEIAAAEAAFRAQVEKELVPWLDREKPWKFEG